MTTRSRCEAKRRGKPGLAAVAVRGCVVVLVRAQLVPPRLLAAHLHGLVWLLVEAWEVAPTTPDLNIIVGSKTHLTTGF